MVCICIATTKGQLVVILIDENERGEEEYFPSFFASISLFPSPLVDDIIVDIGVDDAIVDKGNIDKKGLTDGKERIDDATYAADDDSDDGDDDDSDDGKSEELTPSSSESPFRNETAMDSLSILCITITHTNKKKRKKKEKEKKTKDER